jgi:hypothetical protein
VGRSGEIWPRTSRVAMPTHTPRPVPDHPSRRAGPYLQSAGRVLNPRVDLSFPPKIVIPESRFSGRNRGRESRLLVWHCDWHERRRYR